MKHAAPVASALLGRDFINTLPESSAAAPSSAERGFTLVRGSRRRAVICPPALFGSERNPD